MKAALCLIARSLLGLALAVSPLSPLAGKPASEGVCSARCLIEEPRARRNRRATSRLPKAVTSHRTPKRQSKRHSAATVDFPVPGDAAFVRLEAR